MTDEEIKALVTGTVTTAFTEFSSKTLPGLFTQALGPLGEQLKALTPVTPPPVVTPPPAVTPPPLPGVDPVLNSQLQEMKRKSEEQDKAMKLLQDQNASERKARESAELSSAVNTALSPFKFATDAARKTAESLVTPLIKRTDAGQLIAGDNLTVDTFVKDFLPKDHAYLLAPAGGAGSGVTPGSGAGGHRIVDIDSIKVGMSDVDKAAAYAQVAASLPK